MIMLMLLMMTTTSVHTITGKAQLTFTGEKADRIYSLSTTTLQHIRNIAEKGAESPNDHGNDNGARCLLLVGCLTFQQQASVSQGWICSDISTSCQTEVEAADQTFYLTASQYTDTRLTSPSADPITLGAWQGSH